MKMLLVCTVLAAAASAQESVHRQPLPSYLPTGNHKPHEPRSPSKYPQPEHSKPPIYPEKGSELPKYHKAPKHPQSPVYHPQTAHLKPSHVPVYYPKLKPQTTSYQAPAHPLKSHPPAYKHESKTYTEPHDTNYASEDPYSFAYEVKEGHDDHGRQEQSDGQVVTGSYHVALPDGRKQIVTYTADPHEGFKAQVTYEGEAKYPEKVPALPDYKTQYESI